MPAYLIADVEVTDPVKYEDYRKLTPGAIAKFGGKFVARGGQTSVLEGDWRPHRVVIIEFPSADQARRWYHSEDYRTLLALRLRATRGDAVLLEGWPPA